MKQKSLARSFAEYMIKSNDLDKYKKRFFISIYSNENECKCYVIFCSNIINKFCLKCIMRQYWLIHMNRDELRELMKEYFEYAFKFDLDFSSHVQGLVKENNQRTINDGDFYRRNNNTDYEDMKNDCFNTFSTTSIKCIFGFHKLDETNTYCEHCNYINV